MNRKKRLLFILLCIPCLIFSQKYFILDSLKADFKVATYTLDASELYGIRKNINLFNVFVSKNNILLLSVLPDLDEKVLPGMDERGQNWMALDIEKVKKRDIISESKVKDMVSDWLASNTPEKKTLEFRLVKKENGNYYVSKMCLTEFFSVAALKSPLVSAYGTLNIAEPKVSIKDVEKSFKEQFPDKQFIMDVWDTDHLRVLDAPYSFRNYFSKEYLIKGKKAYQFWTFDGWWTIDGYNEHRGIDRLVYMPEKGIVGGSYDFYFRIRNSQHAFPAYAGVGANRLWSNIINEKVMTAQELK